MRAFVLLILLTAGLHAESIGIANHNPGNVVSWHYEQWPGAVGVDAWHHLIFATDEDGLKAMRFILKAYRRRGVTTVSGIVNRWVGPKYSKREILAIHGYLLRVCQDMKAKPNSVLDLSNVDVMAHLAQSIVYCENGKQPYPDSLFTEVFHHVTGPHAPRRATVWRIKNEVSHGSETDQ